MSEGLQAAGAGRWAVLMPPGWSTMRTDVDLRGADVRRITDRMMRGRSRDELIRTRIEIEQTILQQLEVARRNGATDVHVLTSPIAGVPVSASLTFAPLTFTHDDDITAAVLGALGSSDGVIEHGSVEIAGCPALRRRRRYLVESAELDGELWATAVEYVVEAEPDTLLLLTFSTTTDPVADALVSVFDAITHSLRDARALI